MNLRTAYAHESGGYFEMKELKSSEAKRKICLARRRGKGEKKKKDVEK